MKILVTGAAGMLAADVIPQLFKNGHQVVQTDIKQHLPGIIRLDIADFEAVIKKVKEYRPDYIFHFAAETDVDLCEKNPKHALMVNALGTENIARACLEFRLPLLYISTGAVFSGDKETPYTELDIPSPINVYGKSKLEGERVVQNLLKSYFIIRAGWMVGGWKIDKKFVYKIVQQIKEGKQELRVVADKFGSMTFTKDFAKNLLNVINTGRYGLYHMVNRGTCSRYEIALRIVEFIGLKNKIMILPINSDQYPLPAPRARSEMLENYKLNLLGLNSMPHWHDSLEEYIKTNKDK